MSIVRVLRWTDQAHRQTDKSKYIHIQIHRDTTNGNTDTHIHSEKHTNIQKQTEIHVSRCRKIYRNTPLPICTLSLVLHRPSFPISPICCRHLLSTGGILRTSSFLPDCRSSPGLRRKSPGRHTQWGHQSLGHGLRCH